MKKFILSAAILAVIALSISSCKKEEKSEPKQDVARCWKITVTASIMGQTASEVGYMWGTEAYIDEQLALAKAEAENLGATVTTAKEEASQYTTEVDCLAQNPDED